MGHTVGKVQIADTVGGIPLTLAKTTDGTTDVDFVITGDGILYFDEGSNRWSIARHVDLLNYEADPTGGSDSTTAFQNAMNTGKAVLVPVGTFRVDSTVTGSTASQRVFGYGDLSVIKTTITDGSPTLKFDNVDRIQLSGFRVIGDASANPANAKNTTGIQFVNTCNRWRINDVTCYGVETGFDLNGWIGTADNATAFACGLGFKLDTVNATRLNLVIEGCEQDFTLVDSDGVEFSSLLAESSYVATTSTVDNCNGVVFNAPYWEADAGQAVPFVTFGGTTKCTGIDITGLIVAGVDFYVHPLAFDDVDGVYVSGWFSTGSVHSNISTTANTKNIILRGTMASTGWFHDASLALARTTNVFPNHRFDLWFRGWDIVGAIGCTLSQETTTVRTGKNALKITLNSATANGYVEFRFQNGYSNLPTDLRGKTLTFGAWVYVPNIAFYDDADGASQAGKVGVLMRSYNDSTFVDSATSNHHTMKGQWNFITGSVAMQSDATRLYINVYANWGGATSGDGSEYVVLDSLVITDKPGAEMDLLNGNYVDSDLIPAKCLGGLLIQRGDTSWDDTDQTYVVGDRLEYVTPTAGGNIGEVCTTGGVGGTAVVKTYGSISA